MFNDIIKIDKDDEMFVFKISKKVIDELYAMHEIIVSDGISEMIDYELKEYIQNNLKIDKDYYNKIGNKIHNNYIKERNEKN